MEIKDNVLIKVTKKDINIDGTFVIPDGVTRIGKDAFEDCKSLKNIVIPDSVKEIGRCAFSDCTSLEKINIPNSVIEIDDHAFYNCKSLKKIILPNNIGEISNSTFSNCISLETINIPDSVTTIGEYAFHNCISLIEVSIPDSETEIRQGVFENCKSIKTLDIPNNVVKIDYKAFFDCTFLKILNIPDSIRYIASSAFQNCKNLNLDIKTSLFYINKEYINKTFNVKELTIYNTKVDLDNIETSLREIREEELQDKINYALLDNYISDPKCFKLSEHKKFINKIIDKIDELPIFYYDYREDFNNYIENYVNENKPKELVEIKNIQSMLIDINNYNIDNKGLNNSTALQQYGNELLDYSFYISSILSKLQTNSTNDIATINLNKILSKITKLESRNPDDISKLVEKVFFNVTEEGLVLNKTLINKMIGYTRYKVCSLNDEINGFEILKEIIRICIEKINMCKENSNNVKITDERDIRLLNIDNNSIKSNANEKIDAFNKCELMLSIYNEQINNLTTLNQIHIDKLKELVTHAIPSLLQKTISSKVVLKDKEDVKILNNVCNTLRELIELEENSKIETNSLEVLTGGKEKTYKK